MCMICDDWKKSGKNIDAAMQGAQNLFETMEKIGAEHAKEVAVMLNLNFNYDLPNRDGRIIQAIRKFVTPEPPPPPPVIDRSKL